MGFLNDALIKYLVYTYDDSESVNEYAGPDLDIAKEIYIKTRVHIENLIKQKGYIDKEITVVLKDTFEDKILFEYNTLQDAC